MEKLVARVKEIVTKEVDKSDFCSSNTEESVIVVRLCEKVMKRLVVDEAVYQQIRELVECEIWERREQGEV